MVHMNKRYVLNSASPLRSCAAACLIFLTFLTLAGCQSVAPSRAAHGDTLAPSPTDPCAMRLHDITGAMLLYYTLHHALPDNLEQLRPLADLDAPLDFICPVSHKPYLYQPINLAAPGADRRLLVYDPTPVHQGRRWAILAAPVRPGRQVTMWVDLLDEPTLQSLRPTPATSTTP